MWGGNLKKTKPLDGKKMTTELASNYVNLNYRTGFLVPTKRADYCSSCDDSILSSTCKFPRSIENAYKTVTVYEKPLTAVISRVMDANDNRSAKTCVKRYYESCAAGIQPI